MAGKRQPFSPAQPSHDGIVGPGTFAYCMT
jgi:hypothetical protein